MKMILSMSKMYEGGPGKSGGLKLKMAQAVVPRWLHSAPQIFLHFHPRLLMGGATFNGWCNYNISSTHRL